MPVKFECHKYNSPHKGNALQLFFRRPSSTEELSSEMNGMSGEDQVQQIKERIILQIKSESAVQTYDNQSKDADYNLLITHPKFADVLHENFPGAQSMNDYFLETSTVLMENHNFEDENTMGIAAICRDEIVDPFFAECVKYWGKTFNCCSLAGFLTIGKTGLAAASHHVPKDVNDGLRRFVFFAMSHIAISGEGEIGVVYR